MFYAITFITVDETDDYALRVMQAGLSVHTEGYHVFKSEESYQLHLQDADPATLVGLLSSIRFQHEEAIVIGLIDELKNFKTYTLPAFLKAIAKKEILA